MRCIVGGLWFKEWIGGRGLRGKLGWWLRGKTVVKRGKRRPGGWAGGGEQRKWWC